MYAHSTRVMVILAGTIGVDARGSALSLGMRCVWHHELDVSLHQAIKEIANEELGDGIASAINM